jgi:conjugal transfer pilus assembly protein TraF
MTRMVFIVTLLFIALDTMADKPAGFLWYNIKKEHTNTHHTPQKGTSFKHLSYSQRDAVLRFYTMEALHKARHTKSVEDMRIFLSLQNYWLKESTQFSHTFQKAMLAYPQYDYAVTHPTSNMGSKTTDELRQAKHARVIARLSKTHGLLFFYRGNSPYDQKQIPIIRDFCERFNLALMPISVDGVLSHELMQSRVDDGQANNLGVRYFPAIMLVNPRAKTTLPVAYGLTTQDVLERRLFQVATQFSGEE